MIVACKLPHGLTITHGGQVMNINGANAASDPTDPSKNGALDDGAIMSAGYGLTVLDDAQSAAFEDWSNKALYKEGSKDKGYLEEPFLPLRNGALTVFKSESDARKETRSISTDVSTGFDGLDGDAEIKAAAEAANPNLVESGAGPNAAKK